MSNNHRPRSNGGHSGQGPRHSGHASKGQGKSGWRRERGGSANPTSFQPVSRKKDRRAENRAPSHNGKTSNVRPGFLNVKGCHTAEDLIRLASEHGALSPNNLSAFWSRTPHLLHTTSNQRHDARATEDLKRQLENILATTIKGIGRFDGKDVATTALGMAKTASRLRSKEKDRMVNARSALLQQFLVKCNVETRGNIFYLLASRARSLSGFGAQALSNLAYAYALVEYIPAFDDGSTLFDHIADLAKGSLSTFKPQEISNTAWAFAKVKASSAGLFKQVADTVLKRDLRTFKPQGLSNTVWAFATAGEVSHQLFKKVGDHLVGADLSAFEPQHLSNIIWAFSKAKEAHLCLYKSIADSIDERGLGSFLPQHLSNVVWAFTTAGETNHRLFKKVADSIIERDLETFKPQELSNIAWAYSTAKEMHPRLYKKVADSIVGRALGSFKPQGLSNTVWAFASTNMHHPKLFDKVASAAIAKRGEFNAQEVANTLWAFAAMGRVPPGLFDSFEPTAVNLINECDAQNLANIAWAFAVADVAAPAFFSERFVDAVREKEDDFKVEQLRQLHQWHLWQLELGSLPLLPKALQTRCREAFLSTQPQPSGFQNDVVAALSGMYLRPKEEVLMQSGYRLDATVEVSRRTIGIEVDGPTHFITRKPTGKTILKRRQVASIDGVPIVPVPYWEWDKLGSDSVKKQEYLSNVLGLN